MPYLKMLWQFLRGGSRGVARTHWFACVAALLGAATLAQAAPSPGFRWASRFGSPSGSENTTDMAVDGQGNTVVVGNASGGAMTFGGPTVSNVFTVNSQNQYVAKYDASGNPLWHVPVGGGGRARRVAVDPTGNVYVLGFFDATFNFGGVASPLPQGIGSDVFVARLDTNGTPVWIRRFGSAVDDFSSTFGGTFHGSSQGGIAVAPSGSIYAAFSIGGSMTVNVGGGTTTVPFTSGSATNAQDTAVLRLDPSGNVLAATAFGGTQTDVPRDLVVDLAGNVVVLGVSDGNITLGADTVVNRGNGDTFLARFTGSLQPLFLRGYGGNGQDSPLGLAVDPSANILTTGYYNSGNGMTIGGITLPHLGGLDGYVAKFRPDGQLLWAQPVNGTGDQLGHKVAADAGGFIYLNGRYDSATARLGGLTAANPGTNSALYIFKLDPDGAGVWAQGASATGGFIGSAAGAGSILGFNSGIAYDRRGRFYISGRFEGTAMIGNFTLQGGTGDMFVASMFAEFDIVQDPQSLTVARGSSATFTVVVSSTVQLFYQWYFEGQPIPGATAATYTRSNVQVTDAGDYTVLISSATGGILSEAATLVVTEPPFFVQQPPSFRAVPGTNVTFSTVVAGPKPITYQWRFNGFNIPGANTPSITLSNVTTANNGRYTLIATNLFGTTTSAPGDLEVLVPPEITLHPADQTNMAGDNVSFVAQASGSTTLSYQWRLNGTNLPGAVAETLNLNAVSVFTAGTYSVVVSNLAGVAVSSNALLVVNSAPVVVTQPGASVVNAAASASFSVGVLGDAPFTYQWRLNGTNIAGATGPAYGIGAAAPSHEGLYSVVVSNALGSTTSSSARLSVLPLSVVVPWAAAGGGPGTDVGNAIAVDAAGNSVVAGYFTGTAAFGTNTLVSAGHTDIFLARYNAAGQVLWARRAGGPGYDVAQGVALDAGGNIYVTGAYEGVADFGTNSLTNTTLTSYSDIVLARYDAAGNSVWARSAGAEFAHDEGTAVAVDGAGNLLVAGRSVLETFAGVPVANTGRILVAKFTSAGTEVWAWKAGSYSGGNLDIATGVAADGAGNVLVTGTFHSPLAAFGGGTFTNRGNSDIFLARLDSAGTLQWARQAGGAGEDTASGVALAADGSAYVAGATGGAGSFSPTNNVASLAGAFTDGFVAKYAGDGAVTWVRQFGGAGVAAARGVAVDAAGTVHLTGYFSGAATFGTNSLNGITGSYDAFLARLDAAGNVAFAQQAGGADLSGDFGLAVGVDGAGNSVITGYFSGTSTAGGGTLASAGGEDVLLTRFNQFVGGGVPAMGFQRLGGNLRMRWPLAASSYILQSTTNLLAPVWVDETNALNLSGTDLETDVPVGNTIRFYRLRKP